MTELMRIKTPENPSRTIVKVAASGTVARAFTGEVYTVANGQELDLRNFLTPVDLTGRVGAQQA